MSICKDCLHISVCKDYASYDKDSIISCDNFKNKADYVEVSKIETNFDRIKAMSVEELAEFMYSAPDKICFENCTKDTGNKFSCKFGENVDFSNCIKCMKQYLESEVQGE